MSGGTVKASAAGGFGAIRCSGNLEKTGGSMEVEGSVRCYGNMSINNNTSINGNASCDGNFSMSGGTITKIGSDENYRSNSAVYFGGNFTMSGGKITAKNTSYGISHDYSDSRKNHIMTVTGGTIECISPSYGGIDVYETNVAIGGGTIKVIGAYQFDFHVRSNTYCGLTYGGKSMVTRCARDSRLRMR